MQQTDNKKLFDSNADKILQLWSMQSQIADKVQNQKVNQNSILLIGDTNVGKTTLLYYLSGMKLNLVQNISKKIKEIHPETIYQDAQVNNSQSTTQVPNIFSQITDLQSITLIDMPGINDTKFINALSNMFTFLSVFQKLLKKTKVHIVFVISQEIFDPVEIKTNLQEIVRRFDAEGFRNAKNLSIIFTKTQDDEQTVKDKFIEFIQQIRESIQDDQEQRKLVELIDFIKQLSQDDQIMYIFPKDDPVQEKGLQITKEILKRDLFAGSKQFMLNQLFVDNVLQSQKILVSQFENNLIETIQQSFAQISGCVDLIIGFTKFFHKKFVPGLFESETTFLTQLQSFYHTNSNILQQFSQAKIPEIKFQESIRTICDIMAENEQLFLLDKTFIELFTQVSSIEQDIEGVQTNIHLTIQISAHLKNCFGKILLIFSNFKEYEMFTDVIKEIESFLNWLGEQWFSNLQKIKSLQGVEKILIQCESSLKSQNELKWKAICEQKSFINQLNNFSSKAQTSQSQDESAQEQIVRVQQEVPDNGYYGSTVKQLKKRYLSVNIPPKVAESKSQVEIILQQQKQIEQKIAQIVKSLQQMITTQVFKSQQSRSCKINLPAQKIAFILFQMRKLRHRIFLQSAFRNFGSYLKFIYFSLILDEQDKLLLVVQGFVQNLCMILDQYSLFEQQVVLMLFAHMYDRIAKVFERGIRSHRINEHFLKHYLIKHVQTLISITTQSIQLQQLQDIITTAYSYLISQYSSTREQSNEYQKEMNAILLKVEAITYDQQKQQKTLSQKSTQVTGQGQNTPGKEPNYFVLGNDSYLQLPGVIDKIQLLEQRNTKLQTYQIHYHFHSQMYQYRLNQNYQHQITPSA